MDWHAGTGVTRLVLIRHGEPEASARGRCYGRLDVGLSRRGREQASRVAAFLSDVPIASVYSSPSRRALESADPIAALHRLQVRARDALRELDFGDLEGLTYDEAAVRFPDVYRAWMDVPTEVRFPGGERYEDLRSRVRHEIERIESAHAGRTVAVVAHGGVNRAILAHALGMASHCIFRIGQDFGAVSVTDRSDHSTTVALVNWMP